MKPASRTSQLATWRQSWLCLHRWLGLASGALLVAVGLTGSLFVFHQEIDELLDPTHLRVVQRPGGASAYRPWNEVIAAAQTHAPAGAILSGLHGPPHAGAAARVGFAVPHPQPAEQEYHRMCVDPYTARFLGENRTEEHWVGRLCHFLYDFHYSLKLGETGGVVVGILAIVGLASIGSGLYLWWPRGGSVRHALTVRWGSAAIRVHFDLHRAVGFYFVPVLAAVLVSGIWMNLNEPFVRVVKLFSPGTRAGQSDAPRSEPAAGRPALQLTNVLAIVQDHYPEGRLNWATTPDKPEDPFTVSMIDVPGLSRFSWAERIMSVDQFSGTILRVDAANTHRTAGETFLAWQWPLHSGRAFGWFGRLLVFASGFVPLLLYATGIYVWWRRRRARLKSAPALPLPLEPAPTP